MPRDYQVAQQADYNIQEGPEVPQPLVVSHSGEPQHNEHLVKYVINIRNEESQSTQSPAVYSQSDVSFAI
jgi:hypothetical protein